MRVLSVEVIAEARVQAVQLVDQRAPLRLGRGRHLADQHGRDDGVFVLGVRAGQVAVAFLVAEQELALAAARELGDLLADVL